MLTIMPVMVAGFLAAFKIGELAQMLVSGGGGMGAGLAGRVRTAERAISAAKTAGGSEALRGMK